MFLWLISYVRDLIISNYGYKFTADKLCKATVDSFLNCIKNSIRCMKIALVFLHTLKKLGEYIRQVEGVELYIPRFLNC